VRAAASGAEGVGLAVERAVALLHEAVSASAKQGSVDMKDSAANGNSTFGCA
jgi:hypothetical protein